MEDQSKSSFQAMVLHACPPVRTVLMWEVVGLAARISIPPDASSVN